MGRGNPNWTKGVSGNPGGKPRAFKDYLRQLIGEQGEKAYDIIWAIASGTQRTTQYAFSKMGPIPYEAEPSIRERLDASQVLTEALNGKPTAALEVSGTDGAPFLLAVVHPPAGSK